MNSTDYSTLEEVDEYFDKKVSLINECIELKSLDRNATTIFQDLETSMMDLRKVFQQIKCELQEGQHQLSELKDFAQTMETLNDKLDHMQQNFPPVLKPQAEVLQKSVKNKTEAAATPVVSKQVKIPTKIKSLTVDEFASIPQYMKGRLQYSQINSFIDSFNLAITSKYKLLSAPRKTLKPAEYKICNIMRSEENEETKGQYFCTSENLKEYGNIKMDKITEKILTILRHSKRMREVRGPGSFKRYVVVQG